MINLLKSYFEQKHLLSLWKKEKMVKWRQEGLSDGEIRMRLKPHSLSFVKFVKKWLKHHGQARH